jgi:DNA-directed RNA polymerase specialized sigma subunit
MVIDQDTANIGSAKTINNSDMELFNLYKKTGDKKYKNQLLHKLSGLIHSYAAKWYGSSVSNDVLLSEAILLASKAIDTFNPSMGVQLSTHIVNNLAPLSRIVYTYQNSVRIPENLVTKLNTYNTAVDYLTTIHGRAPTTDELHSYTGWTSKDIAKISKYTGKEMIESAGVDDSAYKDTVVSDKDEDSLYSIYFSLDPESKTFFEDVTGFNHKKKLTTSELLKKYNITQSQLSYKKSLLKKKIQSIETGYDHRK